MKVHQMLICIFILSLQDGNTGLKNARTITEKEGGKITQGCTFSLSGSRKIFCKEGCEEKDILVETTGDRAQRGRYSIEYKEIGGLSSVLYVSVTNLTKSDSGRYRCRLDRGILSKEDFEIRVEDAPITEPTLSLPPRPPSVPSTSTPTTTQSLNVVPGSATSSSVSTDTSTQSGPRQRTAGPGVLLYVGLALLFMVIVLSVAVVIFCRWRASKPKGQPVESEYANVTEASPVYEEIRGDRERSSTPVEISTVYTYAKYVKPNAEDTKDKSSLVNGDTCEKKALCSAPRGDADNAVYSVPRGAPSDGEDASTPLYSTATLSHV